MAVIPRVYRASFFCEPRALFLLCTLPSLGRCRLRDCGDFITELGGVRRLAVGRAASKWQSQA